MFPLVVLPNFQENVDSLLCKLFKKKKRAKAMQIILWSWNSLNSKYKEKNREKVIVIIGTFYL